MKDRTAKLSLALLMVFTWQLTILFTNGFCQNDFRSFNFTESYSSVDISLQYVDVDENIDLPSGFFEEEVLEEEIIHPAAKPSLTTVPFNDELHSRYLICSYRVQLRSHLEPPEFTV
jgi:hypothetical protein